VLVRAVYKGSPVATVWHPEPEGDVLNTPDGNIRVLKGEPAYQLTTGEKVAL
jgi:hypothetical protein